MDDDDEITKNTRRWDRDENPPFVAATVVSAESLAVVDDAEPVHDLAIAQVLDDDDDYANTSNSNLTSALSQPTSTQRSSALTQRTSSLTSIFCQSSSFPTRIHSRRARDRAHRRC